MAAGISIAGAARQRRAFPLASPRRYLPEALASARSSPTRASTVLRLEAARVRSNSTASIPAISSIASPAGSTTPSTWTAAGSSSRLLRTASS
jgi:hypothetical protein